MIISASSTTHHAEHFAKLAQIASDNLYTELLGSKANAILAATFEEPRNNNSFEVTHFLKQGDDIMGMINGYTAEQKLDFGDRSERLILKYGGWRYIRYLVLGLMLHDITGFIGNNLLSDDFYIQMVAIYPAFRGRGYSKLLLNHAQKLAERQDCRQLVLDVDERNHIAIAAYHKVGFKIITESKKILDEGSRWGILRMAREC